MSKPMIGVTTYGTNKEGEFTLPREYSDTVQRAGGVPLLIPPADPQIDVLLARIDGFILAGGGDIATERYGLECGDVCEEVDSERDHGELQLVGELVEHEIPTLAICRGMQLVNVALGGTLHVHLPDVYGDEVSHRKGAKDWTTHPISVAEDSDLHALLGATDFDAVSWHHQAIDRLADGFRVVARAADGCIEAIESAALPSLTAVQWHPEMSAATDPIQQRLFDQFVKRCAGRVG